eukprot:SM000127S26625  [mRNA]  locus=s127:107186:109241:+ [translate_table: standard]
MAAVASGGGGRLRVLCLHGFRASAAILQKQMSIARWDAAVGDLVDLVCINAPMPASGASDLEKYFGPPYFEWWSASEVRLPTLSSLLSLMLSRSSAITGSLRMDGKVYVGADTSITYVCDNLTLHRPFDGLLGFSQGGMLVSYLLALLQEGEVDMKVPPRFCILIGAGLPRADALVAAFRRPITVPSLHLIGDKDFLKAKSELLQDCYQDPVTIHHPRGHVVPRLDDGGTTSLRQFLIGQPLRCDL